MQSSPFFFILGQTRLYVIKDNNFALQANKTANFE